MANSYIDIPADNVTTIFTFPFGKIDRSHIFVLVGGVNQTFNWVSDSSVSLAVAPSAPNIVRIKRTTPDTPVIDFQDGESLTEQDLDNVNLQGLYLAQEAADGLSGTMQIDDDGKVNAQNRAIKNVGTPLNATDAATKTYVDTKTAADVAAAAASATAAAVSKNDAETAAASAAVSAANSGAAATAAAQGAALSDASKLDAQAALAAMDTPVLLSRANHTGTQPVSTITGLAPAASLDVSTDPDFTQDGDKLSVRSVIRTLFNTLATRILGEGQVWEAMSRAANVIYQNTTGRTITVAITGKSGSKSPRNVQVSIDGTTWVTVAQISGLESPGDTPWPTTSCAFIVPPNNFYRVNGSFFNTTWAELR